MILLIKSKKRMDLINWTNLCKKAMNVYCCDFHHLEIFGSDATSSDWYYIGSGNIPQMKTETMRLILTTENKRRATFI